MSFQMSLRSTSIVVIITILSCFFYISQQEAIELDQELFSHYQFSVDQLMELAGYSVACAIKKTYPHKKFRRVIICCGPGNNGGDGLVCARHLQTFGFDPLVIYPKPTMSKLAHQCKGFGISILDSIPEQLIYGDDKIEGKLDLIVDAIFGFSYRPPNRNTQLAKLLNDIHHVNKRYNTPIVSVDIPSGWSVETGPTQIDEEQENQPEELRIPVIEPDSLISLTAPKLCSRYFKGRFHYLGGRFCPPEIEKKYKLNLPTFNGTEQMTLLRSTVDFDNWIKQDL